MRNQTQAKIASQMLPYLLLLLWAISWTVYGERQASVRVDFYQLPMRPSVSNHSVQLVLVCQGTGTLPGLSVRLYCPAKPESKTLCFENCSRTQDCSTDGRLCSLAACAQETKGLAKFTYTYTFDPAAVAAGDAGLSFECAYGWKRSGLLIANSWQATAKDTAKLTTKFTTTQFGTRATTTGAGESTTDADTGAREKDASLSHRDAAGLTLIDKLVIGIAGFCAVVVVTVVAVVSVVCQMQGLRTNDGRSSSRRDSIVERGRDPEVFKKSKLQASDRKQAATLLEMGWPRPDLLPPDGCHSLAD